MLKLVVASAIIAIAGGCTSRDQQDLSRQFMRQSGEYHITMYNGGKAIFEDTFRGTLNQEENTDGVYYIKSDTLIEISGDYVIKQIK